MQWSWLVPVLICASIAASVAFSTWIKARHGYPLEDDNGNLISPGGLDTGRKIELLTSENERLQGQISRLEERVAVLERIATDKSHRLADQIDALR